MNTYSQINAFGLFGLGDTSYTVVAGDTLSAIAAANYGNQDYYIPLADYNEISNPNIITIGQVIQLPDADTLLDTWYDIDPDAAVKAASGVPSYPPTAPAVQPASSSATTTTAVNKPPSSVVQKPSAAPAAASSASKYVLIGILGASVLGGAYFFWSRKKKKQKA